MKKPDSGEGMASVVHRNIQALLDRRTAEERAKGVQERIADAVTTFTGSMPFVYIHLFLFGGWILVNVGWFPFSYPFDPSLVLLAMFASVEAIFLSTFVLITQNRMQASADRRAELNLHIDLLAEHEITRIIGLLTAIGDKLGVAGVDSAELQELRKDVKPEGVLDTMDRAEQVRKRE